MLRHDEMRGVWPPEHALTAQDLDVHTDRRGLYEVAP